MMRTPTKRRSYADHRQYYQNVEPKIDTRWRKGTPLKRNGQMINTHKRRSSDSELLQLPLPFNLPTSSPKERIYEEDDAFAQSFSVSNVLAVTGSDGMEANSVSMDVSAHMEVVSFHFKDLFAQLQTYLSTKSSSETEKNFVEKQMKDLKEHANQIEFMINDLNERASRLERFIASRLANNDENLEWKA